MVTDKEIEEEIEDFNSAIAPFGSRDVEVAIQAAIEGGHDGSWAAEQITEYMDSTGTTQLKDIDPCYVVYDSLLQEARNDIDKLTGKDILNDTKEQIEVYGNCMCTSLDYTEEAKDELLSILKKIKKADYTQAMTWLKAELN